MFTPKYLHLRSNLISSPPVSQHNLSAHAQRRKILRPALAQVTPQPLYFSEVPVLLSQAIVTSDYLTAVSVHNNGTLRPKQAFGPLADSTTALDLLRQQTEQVRRDGKQD